MKKPEMPIKFELEDMEYLKGKEEPLVAETMVYPMMCINGLIDHVTYLEEELDKLKNETTKRKGQG